jgi:hypothetical protein
MSDQEKLTNELLVFFKAMAKPDRRATIRNT